MSVSVFCFYSCACLNVAFADSHDSVVSLFNFSHGLMTTLAISRFSGKNHSEMK